MKKENISARVLLVFYLLALIWILLFKLSASMVDIREMFYSTPRHINWFPFKESVIVNNQFQISEIIDNILIFLPFGGLLGLSFKKLNIVKVTGIVFLFTVIIETLQYLFGLGRADVTDILMNTLGGLIGYLIYRIIKVVFPSQRTDRVLTKIGVGIFLVILLLVLFIVVFNL